MLIPVVTRTCAIMHNGGPRRLHTKNLTPKPYNLLNFNPIILNAVKLDTTLNPKPEIRIKP